MQSFQQPAEALAAIVEKIPSQVWIRWEASHPFLIAIDGRCASGKTTLAAQIQEKTNWPVVHMDHFFLRPEQRTPQRLSQAGGNVDWERFLDVVLLPLRQGKKVSYLPYDCQLRQLTDPVHIPCSPVVLIEGAYCCHPNLWDFYDLHIFLSVDPAEQLARIKRRNGAAALPAFRDQWIPLEEQYFHAFHLPERCALCFSMNG